MEVYLIINMNAGMSRIFCDNSEGTVTTLQPLAFIVADNAK